MLSRVCVFLSTVLLVLPAMADWQRFEPVRAAVGDSLPRSQGITLDLPLVSEDGSAVPMTVTVNSPMRADDYIESIQIFADGNPNPEVVDFFLTPLLGAAEVSSRIRINESQTIWAVARSNTGEVWVTSREVRVTVGGCLMTADDQSTVRLSQPRVAVPRAFRAGQPAEVRTLVTHPMETGLRAGPSGELLPRRLIDTLTVKVGTETALEVRMHTAVSANPYMRFFLAPQHADQAEFAWLEDTGERLVETVQLNVN